MSLADQITPKLMYIGRQGSCRYYWRILIEVSNREHADGAITGTLMREVLRGPQQAHVAPPAHELALGIAQQEGFMAKPTGTFRINGDGSIARAPAWLRKLGA